MIYLPLLSWVRTGATAARVTRRTGTERGIPERPILSIRLTPLIVQSGLYKAGSSTLSMRMTFPKKNGWGTSSGDKGGIEKCRHQMRMRTICTVYMYMLCVLNGCSWEPCISKFDDEIQISFCIFFSDYQYRIRKFQYRIPLHVFT